MSVTTARADLARDLAAAAASGDVEAAIRAVLVAIDGVRDALGWRVFGKPTQEQREALGASRAATIVAEAAAIVWPPSALASVTPPAAATATPAPLSLFPDEPP